MIQKVENWSFFVIYFLASFVLSEISSHPNHFTLEDEEIVQAECQKNSAKYRFVENTEKYVFDYFINGILLKFSFFTALQSF